MDRNARNGVSVSVFLSLACLPCRPPPPQPVTTSTTAIPFRRYVLYVRATPTVATGVPVAHRGWTISVSVSLYERIPADTAIRYGVICSCAMVHLTYNLLQGSRDTA
uniref:Uncharacterized protein n=1 Tax=Oryza meridionalis TaxID=40149 RepID=A0A0E0BWI2_9ORYZ